jgi:hypothetical protein
MTPENSNSPLDLIPWEDIKKGDVISKDSVVDYYLAINPSGFETEYQWMILTVKEWLERIRYVENKPLVIRQGGDQLRVLTDEEAASYVNSQAISGLRKHRAQTAKLLTHIDPGQLSPYAKHELEANRARHSRIASAVAIAKKDSETEA